jgi:hypothetical protein
VIEGWRQVGRSYHFGPTSDEGLATVKGDDGRRTTVYRGSCSIPRDLKAAGWDHIGDPDSSDGLIFDAYQAAAPAGVKMFAVTRPSGAVETFSHRLLGDELFNNSFAAVSPDEQWLVSGEWEVVSRFLVFPTPTLNQAAPSGIGDLPVVARIVLDHPVRRVQGAVFLDSMTLLCSTDDPDTALWPTPRQLLQVRLAEPLQGTDVEGHVSSLGGLPLDSICPGTFEVEGIDYDHESGDLRVAIVPPSPCKLFTTIIRFRLT